MTKILSIACLLFVFLLIGSRASAITIFSPVLEMDGNPGEVVKGVVKVYNETTQDLYLTSTVEGFDTTGESGKPHFISPEEAGDYLKWFKLAEESIVLKPQQIGIIPFTITIPAAATPRGYYAAIFWQDRKSVV